MSELESARLLDAEIKFLKESSEKVYFNSNYKFLSEHRGFRPGCLHVLMGTAGGGKSTLTRSLLLDLLLNDKIKDKVFVWLSEESRYDFLTEFNLTGYKGPALDNVSIFSEVDSAGPTKSLTLLEKFINYCREVKPSIVILDNITTSAFYDGQNPGQQSAISHRIKKLALEVGFALLVVAHTDAKINDDIPRMINMNDIRGAKTIVNLAQFFYILQRFTTKNGFFPTLRVTKHRGQDVNRKLFALQYAPRGRIYAQDRILGFDEMREMYKSRCTL